MNNIDPIEEEALDAIQNSNDNTTKIDLDKAELDGETEENSALDEYLDKNPDVEEDLEEEESAPEIEAENLNDEVEESAIETVLNEPVEGLEEPSDDSDEDTTKVEVPDGVDKDNIRLVTPVEEDEDIVEVEGGEEIQEDSEIENEDTSEDTPSDISEEEEITDQQKEKAESLSDNELLQLLSDRDEPLTDKQREYLESIAAGRADLIEAQNEATRPFVEQVKHQQEQARAFNKHFAEQTQNFIDSDTAFEFDYGGEKPLPHKASAETLEIQKDPNLFFRHFVREDGSVDVNGYNKAVYAGLNIDTILSRFREQIKANVLKEMKRDNNNIDMRPPNEGEGTPFGSVQTLKNHHIPFELLNNIKHNEKEWEP